MKLLTIFNNKGGVGKTTLLYHLGCILAEEGKKVLLVDFDSQCNLTLYGFSVEELHKIWMEEDNFFDLGFDYAKNEFGEKRFSSFCKDTRTIHFILKPTEDGTGDIEELPKPRRLFDNLDMIPGRLSLYSYENKIAARWNDVYAGDPLAIRTITKIRLCAQKYSEMYGYDYVLLDTSPSLGALNKTIIMNADGFVIPALPDMFSLYGIRNIGNAIGNWQKELNTIFTLVSQEKRKLFPDKIVQFLGYTIYNAKKRKSSNPMTWDLAQAHYNYAKQIPESIDTYIPEEARLKLSEMQKKEPIGGTAVMHTHNTHPALAQKYRVPIWEVPNQNIDLEDQNTITLNKQTFYGTREKYRQFARDFRERVERLDDE